MAVSAPPHHPSPDGDHRTGPRRSANRRGQAARSATATDLRRRCRRDRRRRCRGDRGDQRLDATHSEQSGLDTPAEAAATAPTGELVASMHLWHVLLGHGDVWLWLYDDGRLISREQGWVERRLTPEAVARLQDELISTGLFDPDRRPPGSQAPSGHDVQVRNGDRLVNLFRAEGQTWTPEFDRLAGRLATLQSWLPATAWAQREATPYVPARYAICTYVHGDGADFDAPPQPREPADLLPRLPASAAALLATASHASLSEMTREIDPAAHESFGDTLCFDMTSEQAAASCRLARKRRLVARRVPRRRTHHQRCRVPTKHRRVGALCRRPSFRDNPCGVLPDPSARSDGLPLRSLSGMSPTRRPSHRPLAP